MRNKLKHLRVNIGMTQTELAKKVGVSQPNYQRWEVGSSPIPEDKLRKLAKALGIPPATILGKHPPIEAGFYNDSVGDDLNYYGEVAIHFQGGGAPLLLSISEGAYALLHQNLQEETAFVTVESLANQTVIIRKDAIADLYFSSEAFDDFGPEHDQYTSHIDLQMPDARDWEIVESLSCHMDLEDFEPADVKRVQEKIMITDEQYESLITDGHIEPQNLDREREKNQLETDRIFDMAFKTTYQLSSGQLRQVFIDEPCEIFKAFYELIDFDGGDLRDMIVITAESGGHRIIFINKGAIDYVMLPSHKYKEGRIEFEAEFLDSLE